MQEQDCRNQPTNQPISYQQSTPRTTRTLRVRDRLLLLLPLMVVMVVAAMVVAVATAAAVMVVEVEVEDGPALEEAGTATAPTPGLIPTSGPVDSTTATPGLIFPRPDDSAEIEASRRLHSRVVRNVSSLSNIEQFNRDYKNSTSQLIQRSKLVSQKQLSDDLNWVVISSIYSFIVAVFETLGMFVHVGRRIINVIQTNAVLVCTKEYVWTKIIKWIDE
ncbi:hypothetical protein ALC53_08369 [Atta colombica]|uniref:Uncharacterized protein n=1 Tax=Atta colombica TaxID=520822 RepID=A0A195B907_9HYME|nr:hypothetical protein ALC53_08369 [Atta colombica]